MLVAAVACDSELVEPDETRLGADFFPLEVGHYSVFQVENTDYKITGEVVESSWQEKAEVVESFVNQGGSPTYIIYYSRRNSASDSWEFSHAWTARKDGNQAVLVEENVPFLKISFPVEEGRTWDGNALNNLEKDEYVLDSLFSTYITPAEDTIANTMTVIQGDNQDYTVELDLRYEIYALHTGLVYKEDVILTYCTDTDCLGQQKVESGHEYRKYLLETGNN